MTHLFWVQQGTALPRYFCLVSCCLHVLTLGYPRCRPALKLYSSNRDFFFVSFILFYFLSGLDFDLDVISRNFPTCCMCSAFFIAPLTSVILHFLNLQVFRESLLILQERYLLLTQVGVNFVVNFVLFLILCWVFTYSIRMINLLHFIQVAYRYICWVMNR